MSIFTIGEVKQAVCANTYADDGILTPIEARRARESLAAALRERSLMAYAVLNQANKPLPFDQHQELEKCKQHIIATCDPATITLLGIEDDQDNWALMESICRRCLPSENSDRFVVLPFEDDEHLFHLCINVLAANNLDVQTSVPVCLSLIEMQMMRWNPGMQRPLYRRTNHRVAGQENINLSMHYMDLLEQEIAVAELLAQLDPQ